MARAGASKILITPFVGNLFRFGRVVLHFSCKEDFRGSTPLTGTMNNRLKKTGTITEVYRSYDHHFYVKVKSRPNVGSVHRILDSEVLNFRIGQTVEIETYWDDSHVYHVNLLG